nr:immunoglobulin light chain junction region [Macaca mulatta]
GQQYTNSPFSF